MKSSSSGVHVPIHRLPFVFNDFIEEWMETSRIA
jgi:hypothetical protein